MIDTLIGRRFWIDPRSTTCKEVMLLSVDEWGFCFKITHDPSTNYHRGDIMFISKSHGFRAILLKDTYEVVWGGKEYDDDGDYSDNNGECWEAPSLHEYFDTEQEAIAFAKERESEGHPFVLIQYINHKWPRNPMLVEYLDDSVLGKTLLSRKNVFELSELHSDILEVKKNE